MFHLTIATLAELSHPCSLKIKQRHIMLANVAIIKWNVVVQGCVPMEKEIAERKSNYMMANQSE